MLAYHWCQAYHSAFSPSFKGVAKKIPVVVFLSASFAMFVVIMVTGVLAEVDPNMLSDVSPTISSVWQTVLCIVVFSYAIASFAQLRKMDTSQGRDTQFHRPLLMAVALALVLALYLVRLGIQIDTLYTAVSGADVHVSYYLTYIIPELAASLVMLLICVVSFQSVRMVNKSDEALLLQEESESF